MKSITLGEEIFDWFGGTELVSTSFFKFTLPETAKIMRVEVKTDSLHQGIVILGPVKAVIDSVVYTNSHGAIGNTTNFVGTNLVILGLSIDQLEESLKICNIDGEEALRWREEAQTMISKLKDKIFCSNTKFTLEFDEEKTPEYIIFGRRNFLLIGSDQKFVLIHKKQISVREGEYKLIQIDSQDGIIIAKKDNVFHIGGHSRNSFGSLIGEFGVNIASSVLNEIIWD